MSESFCQSKTASPHLVTTLDTYPTHAVLRVIEVSCSGYGIFPISEVAKAYSYVNNSDAWFSL